MQCVNGLLDSPPLLLVPVIVLAVALAHGLTRLVRWRRRWRREQGWQLVHELKAYAAWIESLRGEPFTSGKPEELTSAEPLRNARAIARRHFPGLEQPMLRLLRADNQLMRYLWEQKLVRLSEPGAWIPPPRDPAYRQLRDTQDDLIDDIIARCQELTGDRARPWRGTDLESEFFASQGVTTTPCG